MTELTKYVLYFFIGGTLVSVSTYLGSHGKGFLAALASTLPVISGVTFILIYLNAGDSPTVSFAKNLILALPTMVSLCGHHDCHRSQIGILAGIRPRHWVVPCGSGGDTLLYSLIRFCGWLMSDMSERLQA